MNHTKFRQVAIFCAAVWAFFALVACCSAQDQTDRRGEIRLKEPVYKGVKANAPVPAECHIRNESGFPGGGLCVIASCVINGNYQKVPGIYDRPGKNGDPGKGSDLWLTAKRRPGGYSPGKLEGLLRETMPDEKWVSYYGRSPEVLDELSSKGYPIAATMNTGAQYHYMPIAHMISLIHFKSNELACVVDNNDPGAYHWMPAEEFLRRWYSGGSGWAFAWSRLPDKAVVAVVSVMLLATVILLLAAATAAVGGFGLVFLPE